MYSSTILTYWPIALSKLFFYERAIFEGYSSSLEAQVYVLNIFRTMCSISELCSSSEYKSTQKSVKAQ